MDLADTGRGGLAETFDALLQRAVLPSEGSVGSTFHRRLAAASASYGGLPVLNVRVTGSSPDDGYTQGELLGEGGMGIVHAAHDAVLRRTVAIKRARTRAGTRAPEALVAEARTLAGLDHPNVVPVHALGQDGDGKPILVMKRIAGRPWSALAREGPDLERDVGILLRVIDSLRFAHDRGVLHRDIKPDNVMIGSYGEVYLMDWGCACPAAQAVTTEVVGTPLCIAPEMLSPGMPIGPWTDVFLLGATLQWVLTGAPRHRGEGLIDTFAEAWACPPATWPAGFPRELAGILDKACARDAVDRFRSAEALGTALRTFLSHRSATALAERSSAVLARLVEAIARGDVQADLLFAECRFGFRSALEGWPNCVEAHEGLRQAYLAFVPWKLAAGELTAVEALLPEVEPALGTPWAAEVATARQAQQTRDAVVRTHALEVAARERRNVGLSLLAAGSVMASFVTFGKRPEDNTQDDVLFLGVATIGLWLLCVAPFWRRLRGHALSRTIVLGILAALGASLVNRLGGWVIRAPIAETLRSDLELQLLSVAMLAMTTEPWLALSAGPFIVGTVLTISQPEDAVAIYGAVTIAATAIAGVVLWRRARLVGRSGGTT